MTSSKFSVRPPPFKIPAICKKKKTGPPPPPPGDVLPQDPLELEFAIHGTLFGTRWDRDGPILLIKQSPTLWWAAIPPPANGEWARFDWNEGAPVYSGSLILYLGGIPSAVFNKSTTSYSWVPDFNTGLFNWENTFFAGQQEGKYKNPA